MWRTLGSTVPEVASVMFPPIERYGFGLGRESRTGKAFSYCTRWLLLNAIVDACVCILPSPPGLRSKLSKIQDTRTFDPVISFLLRTDPYPEDRPCVDKLSVRAYPGIRKSKSTVTSRPARQDKPNDPQPIQLNSEHPELYATRRKD